MPTTVDLKCPECGARINVLPHHRAATCEYCGTRTLVQLRDGVLHRPVPPPANISFDLKSLPVATQVVSPRWVFFFILITVGLPLGLGGFGGYMACRQARRARNRVAAARPHGMHRNRWYNHWAKPMIVDVNGDGSDDIIGRVLYSHKAPNMAFVAIDGKTGKRIWQTKQHNMQDLNQSATAVVDGVWLFADSVGTLRAFGLGGAKQRWKASMGERVTIICGATETGFALVKLKNKQVRKVNLMDGGVGKLSSNPPCRAVPHSERNAPPFGFRRANKHTHDGGMKVSKLPNMSVREVLVRDRDGLMLALGNRQPGTRVPMLARFSLQIDPRKLHRPERPKRGNMAWREFGQVMRAYRQKDREFRQAVRNNTGVVTWNADIPGPRALQASTSTPETVGVAPSAVIVAYKMNKTYVIRVAAFALADGKRLWDVALPKTRSGAPSIEDVAAGKTTAFVSTDDRLFGLRLADGGIAFVVGG